MQAAANRPPDQPAELERPPGADNTREQPTDDNSDRAAPVEVGVGVVTDPAQRAERGSRDVDAPRRGSPPGMAPPEE